MNVSGEIEIEKVEPNIKAHSFTATIAERPVKFEVIRCLDSIFLWVGDKRNRSFEDLSLALMSQYATQPVCTKVMGKATDLTSNNLAVKLSKKLGKPVYVSFNLVEDRLTVSVVNKRITEEIHKYPQFF